MVHLELRAEGPGHLFLSAVSQNTLVHIVVPKQEKVTCSW